MYLKAFILYNSLIEVHIYYSVVVFHLCTASLNVFIFFNNILFMLDNIYQKQHTKL